VANTAVTAGSATTVTGASQTNITEVGNLLKLFVGNATANTNFGNGTISLTGNLNAGNILGNGFFLASANGANVLGNVAGATLAYGLSPGPYTSINAVGTLSSLTITGDTVTGLANVNGLIVRDATGSHVNFSTNQTLTAQSTAPAMNKTINIISGVGVAPYNVTMPTIALGRSIFVFNDSAQTINILPADAGVNLDGFTGGAAFTLGAGARIQFVAGTLTKWYALTGVYS